MEPTYTHRIWDLDVHCTPSSHGGVKIPRNSLAVTRHFASPRNEDDAHQTPKSQMLWI